MYSKLGTPRTARTTHRNGILLFRPPGLALASYQLHLSLARCMHWQLAGGCLVAGVVRGMGTGWCVAAPP